MSYSLVFARFPVTRNVPWINFLLFGVSATFLCLGFRRFWWHAVVPGENWRLDSHFSQCFNLLRLLLCHPSYDKAVACIRRSPEVMPDVSAELCRKAGYTYAFLTDPDAEAYPTLRPSASRWRREWTGHRPPCGISAGLLGCSAMGESNLRLPGQGDA